MAQDVIVLLSSDDNEPPVAVRRSRDDLSSVTNRLPNPNPNPNPTTRLNNPPTAVASTPEGLRPTRPTRPSHPSSRLGFDVASDDGSSSPFPSLFPGRQGQRNLSVQTPIRKIVVQRQVDPEVVVLSDTADEGSSIRPVSRVLPRRRSVDETNYSQPPAVGGELPPRKRLRTTSEHTGAAALCTPNPPAAANIFGDSPSGSTPACFRRSSPPLRRQIIRTASPQNYLEDEPGHLDYRKGAMEVESLATKQDTAQCIDLLSSSSSDCDQTGPSKERATTRASEEGLDDGCDLFMAPSPISKGNRTGHGRAVARQQSEARQQTDRLIDPMFLSSSPPPRVRPSSASGIQRTLPEHSAGATGPRARQHAHGTQATTQEPSRSARRGQLRRSLSLGDTLGFSDDDDDEAGNSPNFTNINNLLEAWREKRPPETRPQVAPRNRAEPPGRAAASRTTSVAGNRAVTKEPRRAEITSGIEGDKESRQRDKEADREKKRKDKEAEKEKKQQEKQVERERRRIAAEVAKEKKAEERAVAAAFNDANRSRTDKSIAAPEMIIRLPQTLPQATREVLEPMLTDAKVDVETWTGPVDNVVTWRRKVKSEYKEDAGHWVPVPLQIVDEKHALVILRGDAFMQLVAAQEPGGQLRIDDLGGHVRSMRRHFPGHSVIYLLEGLVAWRAKNRSIRNRQFAEAVRREAAESAAAAAAAAPARGRAAQRRRQKEHVDEEVLEEALLDLQVEHGVLVHETKHALGTAQWLQAFTEQIATSRYRRLKEQEYAAAASFCMDAGQIASGDGAADTYALMLQQIGRVTEPVALGVAARFDTVPKLVRGLAAQGPLALESCLKSRNRNGALSERTVGPALSRRIYKVFMGEDEESADI